jgi:hypothetical protein
MKISGVGMGIWLRTMLEKASSRYRAYHKAWRGMRAKKKRD